MFKKIITTPPMKKPIKKEIKKDNKKEEKDTKIVYCYGDFGNWNLK